MTVDVFTNKLKNFWRMNHKNTKGKTHVTILARAMSAMSTESNAKPKSTKEAREKVLKKLTLEQPKPHCRPKHRLNLIMGLHHMNQQRTQDQDSNNVAQGEPQSFILTVTKEVIQLETVEMLREDTKVKDWI